MKVSLVIATATVVAMTAAASWAGSCCSAGAKAKEKTEMTACSTALSGLELTDEQKTKIAAIEATCKEAGDSKEACEKACKEIRSVLTEEQRAQFDAKCEMKGKSEGHCGG